MKCLIIAEKPSAPLLGLPLIERVILTAQKVGISEFFIVGEKIEETLGEKYNLSYIGKKWNKIKEVFEDKENFLCLTSNHLFEEGLLKNLLEEKLNGDEVILAVDGDTSTGIFLSTPIIFNALEESVKKDDPISGAIKILKEEEKKVKTFDISNYFWVRITDEKGYKLAERFLISKLKKRTDGPVSRLLNRPISIRITKILLKTDVTPNVISIFSFSISVLAAAFLFLGNYLYLVVGVILAQLASIIDGCDGEIARLKFKTTDYGGWFDAVLDRYADAFILFGLIYYLLYSDNGNFFNLFIGFLALVGSFINSYTADKYDAKKKLSKIRMGRDMRIFIILIGGILNQVFLTLLLLAVITNMEVIRRVWILRE